MWGGSVLFHQRKAISSTQRYVEFFKSQFLSPASTQSLRNWDSFFRFQNFYSINVITSLCKHDVKHVATCSARSQTTVVAHHWERPLKLESFIDLSKMGVFRPKICHFGRKPRKCPIQGKNLEFGMIRNQMSYIGRKF